MNAHSHPSLSLGTFFIVLHSSLTRGPTNSVRSDRSLPLSSIPHALAIPLCRSLFVYTESCWIHLRGSGVRAQRQTRLRRCCWSYCRLSIQFCESSARAIDIFYSISIRISNIFDARNMRLHVSLIPVASRDQCEENERHTDDVGWLFSLLILLLWSFRFMHVIENKFVLVVDDGAPTMLASAILVGSLLCECCNDDVFVSWIVHKHTNTRTVCLCTAQFAVVQSALVRSLKCTGKKLFCELDDIDDGDNGDDDKGIRARTFVHEIVYKTKMNQLTIIKQKYFVFSRLS